MIDSRNYFKTNEEQQIYNNREKCRDAFFHLVREFATNNNSPPTVQTTSTTASFLNATSNSIEQSRRDHALRDRIQSFLQMLLPANYWWFSQLFESQLIQLCANQNFVNDILRELDPSIAKLADIEKLRKLQQRISSKEDSKESPGVSETQKRNDGREGPEDFFLKFLEIGNNYTLNTLIARAIANKLTHLIHNWIENTYDISKTLANSSTRPPILHQTTKAFADQTLQMKVLSKVITYT
jgi:hypothetical protein